MTRETQNPVSSSPGEAASPDGQPGHKDRRTGSRRQEKDQERGVVATKEAEHSDQSSRSRAQAGLGSWGCSWKEHSRRKIVSQGRNTHASGRGDSTSAGMELLSQAMLGSLGWAGTSGCMSVCLGPAGLTPGLQQCLLQTPPSLPIAFTMGMP